MQLFPRTNKDIRLFTTLSFEEIKNIISKSLGEFFQIYSHNDFSLQSSAPLTSPSAFNQIFTKILLENNKTNHIKDKSNLIMIVTDLTDSAQFSTEQKLLYLLKTNNIKVDCLHLGINDTKVNNKLEAVSFYTGGLYENVEINNEDVNLTQIMLMEFLPLSKERKKRHENIHISGCNEEMECANCRSREKICLFHPIENKAICMNCYRKLSVSVPLNGNIKTK